MLRLRTHIQAVWHLVPHGSFAARSLLCGAVTFPLGILLMNRQFVLSSVALLIAGYAGRLPPERRSLSDRLGGMAMGMLVMIMVYAVLG